MAFKEEISAQDLLQALEVRFDGLLEMEALFSEVMATLLMPVNQAHFPEALCKEAEMWSARQAVIKEQYCEHGIFQSSESSESNEAEEAEEAEEAK
jgi:hypothetical protein